MGVFDTYAKGVVNATGVIMGCTASWVSGITTYSGQVKYKDEKGDGKLGEVKYPVDHWHIEIKDSDFPGLKDLINRNGKPTITVNVLGVNQLFIGITADAVNDGLCTMIHMRQKTS